MMLKVKIFLILSFLGIVRSMSIHNETDLLQKWSAYKHRLNLRFGDHRHDTHRFQIFKSNLVKINEHNRKFEANKEEYETGPTLFSHLSHEEYLAKYIGSVPKDKSLEVQNLREMNMSAPSLMLDENFVIPESFDWRDYGLVTTPEHQLTCGACWAFAVTTAVETIWARKYGKDELPSLSVQELVDCNVLGKYKNWACEGGFPTNAFAYVRDSGIGETVYYPYESRTNSCRAKKQLRRFSILGFEKIKHGDEEEMKRVVALYGPVTVAIDGSGWGFANYKGGVYSNPSCNPNDNNHALVVVGYGHENGKDYWLIKNSWGTGWGLNGYMKLERNRNNMCGVASMASYAYL